MNKQEKPERDAEVFVKGVKRRTRKKFTAEEKIRIVLEGMKRDVAVTELFWMGERMVAATHGRGIFWIDLSGAAAVSAAPTTPAPGPAPGAPAEPKPADPNDLLRSP